MGGSDCRGERADESPLPPQNLKIQKKEQKEKYITIYYTKIQDLRSCSRTGDVVRPQCGDLRYSLEAAGHIFFV